MHNKSVCEQFKHGIFLPCQSRKQISIAYFFPIKQIIPYVLHELANLFICNLVVDQLAVILTCSDGNGQSW